MRRLIPLLVVTAFPVVAGAQDASSVGVLPAERRPYAVAESERNPFAKKEEKTSEPVVADKESEESRIRQAIEGMHVVGRTRGPDGWKVLLGNLILSQGAPVPPVIEGQTEQLRVAGIFDGMVEIEWVEAEDAGGEPRRMFVPIDLSPQVRVAVGSGGSGDESPNSINVSP